MSAFGVTVKFAFRDLRGGLRGFGIFIACIAIGVAAIGAVSSVSRGLSEGLAREGRRILGGDISFSLIHRKLSPEERGWLENEGELHSIAFMRAMARNANGDATLVEIKATPPSYPRIGQLALDPPMPLAEALETTDGVPGFVAAPELAARLNLRLGDMVELGDARMRYRAALIAEPDKLGGELDLGPRVIVSVDAFRHSGFLQPGALVRWSNRLALKPAGNTGVTTDATVEGVIETAREAFPQAGWEIRSRFNISPRFEKNLERFTQFLVLVGLTALAVGGVGVANAARAFVDRKTSDFATLKTLGAAGGQAFAIAFIEILVIAAIGIVIGAAFGAAAPFAVAPTIKSFAGFPFDASLFPREIAAGMLYGLLVAVTFCLAPIGRAHDAPVSALFRGRVEADPAPLRRRYVAMVAASATIMIGAVLALSTDRRLATIYIFATGVAFVLLRILASAMILAARRIPRPRAFPARLAVANLHRPGAPTREVVLSLGLALALLVALTTINSNLRGQLEQTIAGKTPSFFFLDLRSSQATDFTRFVAERAPGVSIENVPMLRGRIVTLNGTKPDDVRASEDARWALEGDRGVTYADALPEGSTLVAGAWWPRDYAGPPLVSVEAGIARGLGLKIGDEVTMNVMGRNITAVIGNLRSVNWQTLGINFVFVFSPNTFAGAPHTYVATATFPDGGNDALERSLLRDIARAFPTVTSIRVKEALEAARAIVAQLTTAIEAASAIALISSALVLAGVVAAGQRTKLYESVILKTLGATRRRLLASLLIEYGLLGLGAAVFALLAGGVAGWGVLVIIMKFETFRWFWGPAAATVAIALGVTVTIGLVTTWRVLGQKPATYLREL